MRSYDFMVGGYIPGASLVHRLDPRIKVACFLLFMIAVLMSSGLTSIMLCACAVVVVGFIARVGVRTWLLAFSRFAWLLGLVMVMNVLFHREGFPLAVFGIVLPFSLESLGTALLLVTQLSVGIALSVILTSTTMPTDLMRGLGRLARPLRRIGLPVDEASTITFMALRFVPILQEEIRTIVEAQKSRGIDFRTGGLLRRTRALSSVLAPAIQGTIRRGDKLALAMVMRGYRPGLDRSECRFSRATTIDALALVFSAAVALGIIFLKIC